jgi:nicotinamide-nucleotide amidase
MLSKNQAEIISTGTEILMGEIVDTNSSYLATQLKLMWYDLTRITVVGDDRIKLSQALRRSFEESDIVITSGGLGPTEDDLTRECIAEVLGEKLAIDEELVGNLRDRFKQAGREMPAKNIKQASLIPSAMPLPNQYGTAPGWWVEKDGKVIIALPGPPNELKPMWEKAKARLLANFTTGPVLTRTLKTYGLSEAKVAEMVAPFFNKGNPYLGIYARRDGIHLRLISRGENANELLESEERQLEKALEGCIWSKNDETLPEIIGELLTQKGLSLATAEDGTHGIIAGMISDVDGSAKYYRGGLLVCSNEAKVGLGVSSGLLARCGAISAEAAEEMAAVAREKFSADIGLGVTGIGGLDYPEYNVPGLAFVGLADALGKMNWRQSGLPHQYVSRERMAIAALFRLRERLIQGVDLVRR